MKTNQKGIVQIVLIVGILIALSIVGFVLYNQKQLKDQALQITNVPDSYKSEYQQSASEVTPINNSDDLDNAQTALEASDTTEIDAELKSLDTDLSSF